MSSLPASNAESSPMASLSRSEASHFDAIAEFAYQRAGLLLPRDKAPMVLARLGKRMRHLGLDSLESYRRLIEKQDAEDERRELISSLTTNVTSFMREEHHFRTLKEDVLPALAETARAGGRVRLWSAGCSSGQEPYSIAMTILDCIPDAPSLDVRVLATDIDAKILSRAREGEYPESECENLHDTSFSRFLSSQKSKQQSTNLLSVKDEVRSLVAFKELNLLENWPMRGRFDVIFCRNVMIYFDRKTQERLWEGFRDALRDGGYLFVGHSERLDLSRVSDFSLCGTTTYRRTGPRAQPEKRT
ncbi:MAG: protein-glutamate O-methyltransferase [Pseudomonadota bacterium]